MEWVIARVVGWVAVAVAGGAIGYALSDEMPVLSTLAGSSVTVAVLATIDTIRGYRLVRWLRDPQARSAPRDAGLWAELGYRFERTLLHRERALIEERGRLAQFLDAIQASPNGVLLLDERAQIEWCNAVAADHFGLDPARDIGQPVTNLIRAPAFVDHLQSGHFDSGLQFVNPRTQGTLWAMLRRYGEGKLLLLSQDVTERERADIMRRDFVANVSHEIRSPLTVLAGFVETMSSLPLTEVERRRVLTLMQQQTDRMQTLVADLLTLAQLEGSPRPPPDQWVELGPMLARIEADARALSAGRHQVEVDRVSGIELAGAPSELHSAVANVVGNAVRYTPESGRITVGWSMRGDGRGVIEVRDSGIGIAPEHLPRLVERFYRVDTSRSRDTGGTGLGLSIVKHVLQRHGGELEIESELGRGSSFRLVFPAARVRISAAPSAVAQPQPATAV
jgi:two-component system phosphate regulon sensor histidine kinase PhoR